MASRPIKRSDCDEKMKIRKKLVEKKFEQIADAAGLDTPTYHYFNPIENGGVRNSYIFDRDDILDIMLPKSAIQKLTEEEKEKMPTHLLVVVGAHHKRVIQESGSTKFFERGQPTVILMGTKIEDPERDVLVDVENIPVGSMEANYKSPANMGDEIVGYEYPPSASLIDVKKSQIERASLTFEVFKDTGL